MSSWIRSARAKKKPQERFKGPYYLSTYDNFVALKFADRDNFTNGLKLLDKEKGIPFDMVGSKTLIVPDKAVPWFKGLKFKASEVLSVGDLLPEEIAALRAEYL